MLLNTTATVAPLASASAISPSFATGGEAGARAATFAAQNAVPASPVVVRQEKPVERTSTNTSNTDNTLFLAQLFGAEDASVVTESNFAQATEAYRNILTPKRQYSPALSPEMLQEFSEVKYKPGLRPPEPVARRLSLVA